MASNYLDFGTITNPYGASAPKGVTYANDKHTGLDIKLSSPLVHPITSGTVEEVGKSGAYGNYVWVKNSDGLHTLYAHLKTLPAVVSGQDVNANSILGIQGRTGQATGDHLHIEIRTDKSNSKSTIDPEKYIKSGIPSFRGEVNKILNGEQDIINFTDENGNTTGLYNYLTGKVQNWLGDKAMVTGSMIVRALLVVFGIFLLYAAITKGFLGRD